MLTLTFLGVGSAFARRNFQSNALVEAWSGGSEAQPEPDDNLLIDFGATGPTALHTLKEKPGFSYLDRGGKTNYLAIRRVILTHAHADHVGGMEELAWSAMSQRGGPDSRIAPPELLLPSGLFPGIWVHTLQGGLGAMYGRELGLEDFFRVSPLALQGEHEEPFLLAGRYEGRPVRTDHIRIRRRFDWPSYGVHFVDRLTGATALFSGDSRFDPEGLLTLAQAAAVCFHEVQLEPGPHPVHATLEELASLPAELTQRMFLYHYSDEWDEPRFAWVGQRFAGFAAPGERYTVFA